jgi:hypothetical protein
MARREVGPRVREAIENVYRCFADVPNPRSIDGCPCCIDGAQICHLVTTDLRDVSPEILGNYASCVFLTVGSLRDFLYLLPRILELSVTGQLLYPDPEVVAKKVKAAEIGDWTPDRRMAVLEAFDARFADSLEIEDSGHEINQWLCAIGHLLVDLEPYLRRIAARPLRLVEFYEVHSRRLVKRKLSGFWSDCPAARQQVVEWFQSGDIRSAIESAYGLSGFAPPH